jgi:hypothetical protein
MSINSAMSRWHLEYGDQNSRWSATVARNCLVAATLLGYLKNTTPKLDEIPLDRGLLLIQAPEYSADGQQTQLLDTMPQFVSPTWTAVVTPQFRPHAWPTFNTPQSPSQTPSDVNTPSPLPPSTSPDSSASGPSRTCRHCQTDFANTSSFNQHMRHPPKRCPASARAHHQHVCTHCGRKQTNKANLDKHIQRHCRVLKRMAHM